MHCFFRSHIFEYSSSPSTGYKHLSDFIIKDPADFLPDLSSSQSLKMKRIFIVLVAFLSVAFAEQELTESKVKSAKRDRDGKVCKYYIKTPSNVSKNVTGFAKLF